LRDAEHERGGAVGEAVLVVQEEHTEPDHRDLRVDVEPTRAGESEETAVAQDSGDGRRLDPVVAVAAAHDERSCEGSYSRERREEEERGLRPSAARKPRNDERGDEPAERDRGLPAPARQASLA